MSAVNEIATPRMNGCRWPAEWEPHTSTWMAWPHRLKTWPGRFESIPQRFAQLIGALARFERVNVLAGGEEVMAQAQSLVGHLDNVVLHDIPTNDAWARDFGPLFLAEKASAAVSLVDWEFNAWGGKYPAWQLDNDVPRILAQQLGLHRYVPGVVLEGGSIEGNGCGTLLTTESCLLDPRRNPHLKRSDIEHLLREYCCVSNVIWLLGGPLAGDDTDGHIDQLARFVSPHEIVVAVTDDPHDCNYPPLLTNLQRLRDAADRWTGEQPLQITPLPLPSPIVIE